MVSADIESKLRQIEEDPEGAGTAHLYSVTLKISGVANRAFEPLFERQTIAQVRTVYSFVGESKALNSYYEAIQNTLKLGYKAGMAKGLGIGCTYGIACMSWALWNQHGLGGDNVFGSCCPLHNGLVSLMHCSGKGKPWDRLDAGKPCALDHTWKAYDLYIGENDSSSASASSG
uniref:Uncharacterized protein n=1 Tax=Zea mays TaxID=4577 RepID=A0A804LD83_MAIZE